MAGFRAWWSTAHSSVVTHRVIKWASALLTPPMTYWVLTSETAFRVVMTIVSFGAFSYAAWSSEEAALAKEAVDRNPPD